MFVDIDCVVLMYLGHVVESSLTEDYFLGLIIGAQYPCELGSKTGK